MRLSFIFLFFFFTGNAFSVLKTEKKLLHLVKIEIKSIKQMKKRNAQLNYRLFELYSERMRLQRKIETHNLIKNKLTKPVAFKKSNIMFSSTQRFGKTYLKKYKKSRYVPDVYLKLAANIIEIKNDLKKYEKTISYYLDKALEKGKTPQIRYQVKVVMAELYYNLKKFDKAEMFYQEVVQNKSDLAYTKNMLNYSWSQFQNRKYSQAVRSIKKAFFAWKANKKYYDVNERIATAISYFHVYNKTPEQAVIFHAKYNKENLLNLYYKLLTLSQKIISPSKSLLVEKRARGYCKKLQNNSCLFRLSEFKLELYREGKDYVNHNKTSTEITKEFKLLTKNEKAELEDSIDESINNIGEVSSFIQGFAYKGHYVVNSDKEKTYLMLISNYSNLKVLNPVMIHEYDFLSGELSYKEGKFAPAAKYYLSSLKLIPKKLVSKFKPKLLDSMLALANEKTFNDNNFYEKSSTEYINYYPKENKTEKVYNNLFNFYITNSSLDKSQKLIGLYNKNRPDLVSTHREMYTAMLSEYIKVKNKEKLTDEIISLKKGYLGFDKNFIEKNVQILSGLVFEETTSLEKLGKIEEAIITYEKIYNNSKYPSSIRLNGAFNLAIHKAKKSQVDESYEWVKLVLKSDQGESLRKKLNPMLAIAEQLFLSQRLLPSKKVYSFIANNHCSKASEYFKHFTKIQQINLVTNDIAQYKKLTSTAISCNVPPDVIVSSRKSYVDHIITNNNTSLMQSELRNNVDFAVYQDEILDYFLDQFWANYQITDLQKRTPALIAVENFSNGNAYLTEKGRAKLVEMKKFISFAHRSLEAQLEIKPLDNFLVGHFEHELQKVIMKFNSIKDEGTKFIDNSSGENIYSASLALIYDTFSKLKKAISTYKVNTSDQDLLGQVKANINQMITGLSDQQQEYLSSYQEVKKKTTIKNHFVKLFDKKTGDFEMALSVDKQSIGNLLRNPGSKK